MYEMYDHEFVVLQILCLPPLVRNILVSQVGSFAINGSSDANPVAKFVDTTNVFFRKCICDSLLLVIKGQSFAD